MTFNIHELYNDTIKKFRPVVAGDGHRLVWDVYFDKKNATILFQDSITHDVLKIQISSQIKKDGHFIYYDKDTSVTVDFFDDSDFHIIEYRKGKFALRYKSIIPPPDIFDIYCKVDTVTQKCNDIKGNWQIEIKISMSDSLIKLNDKINNKNEKYQIVKFTEPDKGVRKYICWDYRWEMYCEIMCFTIMENEKGTSVFYDALYCLREDKTGFMLKRLQKK